MPAVKIALIGAGSAALSVRLVNDLCKESNLAGSLVSLMDVDEQRLKTIYELGVRYTRELGAKLTIEQTSELEKAIADADFVINTALVGGHHWMEVIRQIGEANGYYRGIDSQEFNMVSDYNTLSNFNQLEFFIKIGHTVAKLAPNAWLLQTANPVFEGTTLIARETNAKVVGFCDGSHRVFDVIEKLGLPSHEVDWQVAGFNHAIWLNRFNYKGSNAYSLLDQWIERHAKDWKPSNPFDDYFSPVAIDMYKFYGLFPIGDTVRNGSWKYNRDLATKQQWYGQPWGGPDSELGWNWYNNKLRVTMNLLEKIANDNKFRLTDRHSYEVLFAKLDFQDELLSELKKLAEILADPERTSENLPHVPFISALTGGQKARLILNVLNTPRIINDIPEDVVVEVPVQVDSDGVHAEQVNPPLPKRITRFYLYPRMVRMELSLEAFITGDIRILEEVLERDPRTRSSKQVKKVLDEIMALPFNRTMREHYGYKINE